MTMQDRHRFALDLAQEAGRLAQTMRADATGLRVDTKGPQDFVTAADLAVETLIRDRITARFPDDAIIGEEGGHHGNPDAPHVWIIDPIDGTTNFMRGLPDWAISIGCTNAGALDLGVIFAPDLGLTLDGLCGQAPKATINGAPLTPSTRTAATEALVAVGWSARTPFAQHAALLDQIVTAGGEYRRSGAATIGLIGVAAGWVDAYVEQRLNLWDAAAGIAIIRAAGGVIEAPAFSPALREPAPFLALGRADHALAPLLRRYATAA